MQLSNNQQAFLALVRAGLWEKDAQLSQYGSIDFNEVCRLSEEQSVVGLVTAGIEHVVDVQLPKEVALQYVGRTLQLEQRNVELNDFITKLVKQLRGHSIYGLLVKGQGVAQNYERPLWRASGDVDLLLDEQNYEMAKKELLPQAYDIQTEDVKKKHQALSIMGVEVELHGKLPFQLSMRVDEVVDAVIENSLKDGGVCAWRVDDTDVFLPNPDNHIILVFTHFLRHFFIEGVGLRQICDWCRILWRNQDSLNVSLLENRLMSMGLMSEWKVFGSLAVDSLGMPKEAMPFYDSRYTDKGEQVVRRILKSGNFGHNNDLSYRTRYSGFSYKIVTAWRRFLDFASLTPVFPIDAPKFFFTYLFHKVEQ